MAIRVALNHKTFYRYDKPVWLSPHVVRLRPAPHCRTPIVSYSLRVLPAEHFINWQQDPYSNRLARLVFPKKTKEFGFEVDLIAELTVINPFDFFLEKSAEQFPFEYDATLARELTPYLETLPLTDKISALVELHRAKGVRTIDHIVAVNQDIQRHVKYLIRLEPGIQTPEETLTLACGSCRDSAWLAVQVWRQLGVAARFVSGYLIQLKPDVKSLDGPSGASADFTDLHAWCEVYLPGAGWVGMDPTSGLLAGEGHIPLACTADPATAAPVTGFFSVDESAVVEADPDDAAEFKKPEAKDSFIHTMSVTRIHEDPRVTKPYTDAQWEEIEALGHQVDRELIANDVRLTMGGEPTFVSVDDMDGPEWNSLAMGPKKRELADKLFRRLKERFAPGGLMHHGQGKWYPGEPLPRWAFGLYFRKDGQPIWRDKWLSADDRMAYHFNANHARDFISHLAQKLGCNPRHAQPGFEDVWYYLWKERRLPTNVDPLNSKIENEENRKRLAKVFEQGLDHTAGYALPLKKEYYTDGSSQWVSGSWLFRSERMYLIPGDSPMGYRLPLDSIPWVSKSEFPYQFELDPTVPRRDLPERDALSRQRYLSANPELRSPEETRALGYMEQTLGPTSAELEELGGQKMSAAEIEELKRRDRLRASLPPAQGESASYLVRTALCTETRNGTLHVFMPPARYLEDYLNLIAAVEDTAAELKLPVMIEGYTPPTDPRLNKIGVTPDPGVIEVNTQPVKSWDDLVKNTQTLYEEAHYSRLGTEKFMLDGRHTGTGGGNHIVVGGETPLDSPFLRRPDLLRSLVGYWHNHPALSFLFSGQFVGPTSQAPRIDEARNDQVYELELAFKQIPEPGGAPIQPWLVDRIFRNLLIDSTGNTHRAEFCIDKLYSPDSATGRLGLLEMRAFEMPPHAQMSLTQHLLLRALISKFWKEPYRQTPVRWRTEIHDKYVLPWFVMQDLEDVLTDLDRSGYPIKPEWFAPHAEFRFPVYGTLQQRDVSLELRQAIEPWHVLGEEGTAGGTVRFVDSSVERMQVLVNGMTDPRHVVLCNGHRVPLTPTGRNGQYVAGVRFRAWRPPNCLHPTIPVHAPLVFDLVDTWSGRSTGGCTYHVAHPGGRSYDTFPVNAYEAESRRISRFYNMGHTPGPLSVPEEKVSREFPLTLDLRRV